AAGPALALVVIAFLLLTIHRNTDFRSHESIWSDTIRKRPRNARAHHNLGYALRGEGRQAEAIAEYEKALQLNPAYPDAQHNLAVALCVTNQPAAAVPHLERALQMR